MRFLHIVLIAAVIGWAAPARAQSENPDIDRGVKLYKDLEYEDAIKVLDAALESPRLTVEERTVGYLHLALAHLALRHTEPARDAFRKLLEADRDFVLPADASQTAHDLFDEVKRSLPPPPPTVEAQLSASASPASPAAGAAVTVTASLTDPDGKTAKVIVHHRVRGARSYSTVTAAKGATGWSAIIPGAFVQAPALEYWVEAADAGGAAVATDGSAAVPLVIVIGDNHPAGGSILGKWWFWAGATAVVAGAVGGVLLLSGGGNNSTDSTVIITV
ncbi:MAG TPA: hypothetical protein VL172_01845, partial [Kofleriaceae bacterium]|nr:hypothetical protein [Kofleriaceae bacterium]